MDKKEILDKLRELEGTNEINVRVGQKRTPLPPNIMVFQAFAYLAATALSPSTNKVLMLFLAHSGYENFVGIDQKTIAEDVGLSNRSVSNAIKELEENKIIVKTPHPSDRRRNDYFLNPFGSWKGNAFSRKEMIRKLPSNQLSLFGISPEEHSAREFREIKDGNHEKMEISNLDEPKEINL